MPTSASTSYYLWTLYKATLLDQFSVILLNRFNKLHSKNLETVSDMNLQFYLLRLPLKINNSEFQVKKKKTFFFFRFKRFLLYFLSPNFYKSYLWLLYMFCVPFVEKQFVLISKQSAWHVKRLFSKRFTSKIVGIFNKIYSKIVSPPILFKSWFQIIQLSLIKPIIIFKPFHFLIVKNRHTLLGHNKMSIFFPSLL